MFEIRKFINWLFEVNDSTPHVSCERKETLYEHAIATAYAAAQDRASRRLFIAALMHDIGKPQTLISVNGESIFYFHEMYAYKIDEFIDKSDADYNDVYELITYHMLPHRMKDPAEISTAALSVFADIVRSHDKSFVHDLLALYRYDTKGTYHTTPPEKEIISSMLDVIIKYANYLQDVR